MIVVRPYSYSDGSTRWGYITRGDRHPGQHGFMSASEAETDARRFSGDVVPALIHPSAWLEKPAPATWRPPWARSPEAK